MIFKILNKIIQSAGTSKTEKKKLKTKIISSHRKVQEKKNPTVKTNINQYVQTIENIDDEETDPSPQIDELNQLTGKPYQDDELLFAVPVVAPYSTLLSYKFVYMYYVKKYFKIQILYIINL